jgi:hypothetical protein
MAPAEALYHTVAGAVALSGLTFAGARRTLRTSTLKGIEVDGCSAYPSLRNLAREVTDHGCSAYPSLRNLAREVNDRAGICGTPEITAEELQAQMFREGVRPEDNAVSRELFRMRYGDDDDQDKEFPAADVPGFIASR